MKFYQRIYRYQRILKLRYKQCVRLLISSKLFQRIPNVWKNKRTLYPCFQSIGIISLSLCCVLITYHHKKSIDRTIQIVIEQQKYLQQANQNHAMFEEAKNNFGKPFMQLFNKISANDSSLSSILNHLQHQLKLTDLEYKIEDKIKTPDLSIIQLNLQIQSIKDFTILEFLNRLNDAFPGLINYHKIEMKRIGKIMTRAEFKEFLIAQRKNKQITPSFNAEIACHIIFPTVKYTQILD